MNAAIGAWLTVSFSDAVSLVPIVSVTLTRTVRSPADW